MSYPPVSPAPEMKVCLDCGWTEFLLPDAWLSAGWLHGLRKPRTGANVTPIRTTRVASENVPLQLGDTVLQEVMSR